MSKNQIFEKALTRKAAADAEEKVKQEVEKRMIEGLYNALQEISSDFERYGITIERGRDRTWEFTGSSIDKNKKVILLKKGNKMNVLFWLSPTCFYVSGGTGPEKWDSENNEYRTTSQGETLKSTVKETTKQIVMSVVMKGDLPVLTFKDSFNSKFHGPWYVPDSWARP